MLILLLFKAHENNGKRIKNVLAWKKAHFITMYSKGLPEKGHVIKVFLRGCLDFEGDTRPNERYTLQSLD